MRPMVTIVMRDALRNSLRAALGINRALPPDSQAKVIYNLGFEAAIFAIAQSHGFDRADVDDSPVRRPVHPSTLPARQGEW